MSSEKTAVGKSREGKPRFLAVDFFCGAGGTTCGLRRAGGYVIAGIDKDPSVGITYSRNNRNRFLGKQCPEFLNYDIFPKSDNYPDGKQGELFEALFKLLSDASERAPDVPLLFAICAPCQPFTTLARKEMTVARQDKRARDRNLLSEAAEFVRVFEPEYILSENVAGISDPVYGGIWQEFEEQLATMGYDIGSTVVDAADFGVPQYRKRSILLGVKRAHKRRSAKRLVVPTAARIREHRSVAKAIGHLPSLHAGDHNPEIPNHRTRRLSPTNILRLRTVQPGQSNAALETSPFGDLSLPCHRRVNAKFKQRCFNDVYTRMHPHRPAPTITTKCHSISNGRFGHFDKRQNRGISLREAAALQTFPDRYVFYPENKIGVVARMIGNAVPPRLAQFFAKYLVSGAAERSATSLLP